MGIITSIIIALLSIVIDPTGKLLLRGTSNETNSAIVIDPTGKTSTTGVNNNAIVIDPTGKN